jgi:hypothetical protein
VSPAPHHHDPARCCTSRRRGGRAQPSLRSFLGNPMAAVSPLPTQTQKTFWCFFLAKVLESPHNSIHRPLLGFAQLTHPPHLPPPTPQLDGLTELLEEGHDSIEARSADTRRAMQWGTHKHTHTNLQHTHTRTHAHTHTRTHAHTRKHTHTPHTSSSVITPPHVAVSQSLCSCLFVYVT